MKQRAQSPAIGIMPFVWICSAIVLGLYLLQAICASGGGYSAADQRGLEHLLDAAALPDPPIVWLFADDLEPVKYPCRSCGKHK